MGRRAKPAKVKAKDKRPTVRKAPTKGAVRVHELAKRLAEALEREKETLEQQTATNEILRIISQSPTDAQPVFDAIVRSAQRLLSGYSCAAMRRVGDVVHLAAYTATGDAGDAELTSIFPASIADLVERFPDVRRVWMDGNILHDPDFELGSQDSEHSKLARARGFRARLHVPMRREGLVIGDLSVTRREPGPFAADEITLLQTFADQAVIAIENVRLFKDLQQKNDALTQAHTQVTETLEQQTATSEVLRVISSTQTDLKPVFDTIVRNAGRVCDAVDTVIILVDGVETMVAAHWGPIEAPLGTRYSLTRGTVMGRAILDARAVHVDDITIAPDFPQGQEHAAQFGHRTTLAVPLLREARAIGSLLMRRAEVRPFSDKQIAMLQTFADQAVIAIENVRLFTELQQKNAALTEAHAQVSEALEQQTATGEILRVIASSPTDVQPVLDAIARSVVRLCDGLFGAVFRFDGELLHFAAHYNFTSRGLEAFERVYPVRLTPEAPLGPAILERRIVHIPDTLANVGADYTRPLVEALGHRSLLAVPMLREGTPLGTINVARATSGPFTDTQIELLKTFADQAVIAIENVRLFTALQASNRELTTALDTQTATSDILRVISRSQTDVQPVFDAIVASAVRLLGAYTGALTRVAGDQLELAALTGVAAQRAFFPQSLQSAGAHAQAIRDRAPLNIADASTDPRLSEAARATAHARGARSVVVVPLLRHDEAVGALGVNRREPGGFTDDEIALLQTFADQAVIAIENARLLSELQARTAELTRSVDELTALGDVGRVLSSTLDLETVLQTIVTRANQLTGTAGCTIWEYDEAREEFRLRVSHYADAADAAVLQALGRVTTMRKGQGVTTQVVERRQPVQIRDIAAEGAYESPIRQPLIEAGHRALLGVPLLSEDEVIGVLAVTRKTPGEFEPEIVRLLSTFATQSALAIQNARLFLEIEDKSRQLEAASQHKSEFLANMSHELRTPLNAIIGFSEVLTERMFGELNEKQDEYLKDIYASGQHLLSLINDILDLSKIEAGRMELEPTDFDLPSAIDNALTLVHERAGRRGIALGRAIDGRLGTIRGDERKVKQVVLNLLSNALKFTPEGGRIDVSAGVTDELVEVSVADTGVGIAPEDQEAVFEEFRQVGTADKKVEGTGLGLALSRKFIELHGGRIWVRSQVGHGSTFTFTLPVRREPSDRGGAPTLNS